MDKWKTLSKKTILTSKLFEVIESESKLPSGIKKIQQNVYRKSTVCVFPVEKDSIYLISEYRDLWEERMLHAVAGFVDDGETSLQTAKRELMEEAGLSANHWEEIARVKLAASVVRGIVSLFLAKDLESLPSQKLEDDESIKVIKMSLKEASEKVLTGEISDSATMVGILMVEKLKRQKKI